MTALYVIDVQEKLFPCIANHQAIFEKMQLMLEGAKLLDLPIITSEQYPEGLGRTILDVPQIDETKTCFAAKHWKSLVHSQWIVMGIETHVCVLQTVQAMCEAGKRVIVLAEATGSRNPLHHELALDEMRHRGARISSIESVLFEILGDAKHPKFKAISKLVK